MVSTGTACGQLTHLSSPSLAPSLIPRKSSSLSWNLYHLTISRYFPTDELENVPERPEVAAARANAMATSHPVQVGEETGLPFIGYTYTRLYVPKLSLISTILLTMVTATDSAARAVYKTAIYANFSRSCSFYYLMLSMLHHVPLLVYHVTLFMPEFPLRLYFDFGL